MENIKVIKPEKTKEVMIKDIKPNTTFSWNGGYYVVLDVEDMSVEETGFIPVLELETAKIAWFTSVRMVAPEEIEIIVK